MKNTIIAPHSIEGILPTTKPSILSGALAFILVLGGINSVLAQTSPKLPTPPPTIPPKVIDSSIATMTNPPVKTVSPGVYELGHVRIIKDQKTVSFPAKLGLNNGLMEYLLVTGYGKTHESVLRTEVPPYQIHTAMLLLGAKGSSNQLSAPPSSQISNPSKKVVGGDKVTIGLSWTADGKKIDRKAEELLFNRDANAAMKSGGWVYNGSAIWNGSFLAQKNGSVASLVTDVSALINYTGTGHENDQLWTVNTNSLPPFDVPVEVSITLVQ